MAGRIVRGMCMPRQVKSSRGRRGWAESDASGAVFYADEMVDDVRQGRVHKSEADVTPGFGTWHPQDVKQIPPYADPSPIPGARPISKGSTTLADLDISDQEMERATRTNTKPRRGY